MARWSLVPYSWYTSLTIDVIVLMHTDGLLATIPLVSCSSLVKQQMISISDHAMLQHQRTLHEWYCDQQIISVPWIS